MPEITGVGFLDYEIQRLGACVKTALSEGEAIYCVLDCIQGDIVVPTDAGKRTFLIIKGIGEGALPFALPSDFVRSLELITSVTDWSFSITHRANHLLDIEIKGHICNWRNPYRRCSDFMVELCRKINCLIDGLTWHKEAA